MAGGANDRSTLRWFGPNTPSIGQTSVAFGLRFLARGFLFGARAPAFRRFGFRRCRPRHPGLRVVAFPSFPVRCFPRSAHPLSDPSWAGLPSSGPPQSAPPLSGSPQSAQRESGPWLGAALRSPVLRPGQKISGISTAPWRSDCGRVDYKRTASRSSDLGVSEPVPSLSVPLVSVLWLEPTLRKPVFAYPAIRSPLLCWCCLSQSGLSRWPGKPGDRLVGST